MRMHWPPTGCLPQGSTSTLEGGGLAHFTRCTEGRFWGRKSRTCSGFQCINFHRVEVKLDRQRWPASVSCWRAARRFEPNAGRASRFAHTARTGDGFDRRVRCPRPLTHRCYGWRSVGCRPRLALNNIAAICCVSGLAVPANGYFDTRAFAASRLPAFRRRSISIAVLALAHFIIKICITTAIAMAISAVQSRSMAIERRQKRRRSGRTSSPPAASAPRSTSAPSSATTYGRLPLGRCDAS